MAAQPSNIIDAVNDQDVARLSEILKNDGDHAIDIINFRDEKGRTPLFIAALNGYRDCLVLLLSRGADVESRDDSGYTCFHIAVEQGHLEESKIMMAYKPKIDVQDSVWGSTPIVCSAYWGYDEIVEMLLKANPDVSICAVFDYSALGAACLKGHLNIANMLLEHGESDIEHKSTNGATPLLLATSAGHLEIVQPLLEHGADVNAVDNNGMGMLHMLAAGDNAEFIDSLVQYCKASTNIQDKTGATPIHIAVTENQMDNVKTLVRNGANTALQDKSGNTCLHIAATKGLKDILTYLVSVGVNASIVNSDGLKAIDCAHVHGHSYLVEVLKRVSTLDLDAVQNVQETTPARPVLNRAQSAPTPAPRVRSRTGSESSSSSVNIQPVIATRASYVMPVPSPIGSPTTGPAFAYPPPRNPSQSPYGTGEKIGGQGSSPVLGGVKARKPYDQIKDSPCAQEAARPLPAPVVRTPSTSSHQSNHSGYSNNSGKNQLRLNYFYN